MDPLGIFVTIARGLHLAAVISAFGTLIFHAVAWKGALRTAGDGPSRELPSSVSTLLVCSLYAAILTSALWLLLQTAGTSGAETLGELLAAVPLVATSTTFGQALLLRAATLVAAASVLRWRHAHSLDAALVLITASLALQSGFSHAIAGDDWYLLVTHTLHIIAAGAWLGALPPLWLSLKYAPATRAGLLLARFSYLGITCVAVLLYTAYVQYFGMIGSLPALVGTSYGHFAILKAIIFLLLLLCAAVNRIVWTPLQVASTALEADRGLRWTVAVELLIGIGMVASASSLASTPPALHEQPNWPFSVQFDIAGFYYPPMWDKLERSAAAIVAAVLLVAIGFLVRRFAWVPFGAASIVLLAAPIPQTEILFKPAHPKTFYVSPSTFPVASIAKGLDIYEAHCARCHDPKQRVIPEFSSQMPVIPPRLNSSRVSRLRDGNLFWAIAHGIDDPRGGRSMPGFENVLGEDDIWHLIDYLRANAAPARGQTLREVQAPAFNATCPDAETVSSTSMRGQVVHLIVANGSPVAETSRPFQTKTVLLAKDPDAAPKLCMVQELEAWTAYAAIAGVSTSDLAGTVFLIDANGWLRYVFRAEAVPQTGVASAIEELHKAPLSRAHFMHDH